MSERKRANVEQIAQVVAMLANGDRGEKDALAFLNATVESDREVELQVTVRRLERMLQRHYEEMDRRASLTNSPRNSDSVQEKMAVAFREVVRVPDLSSGEFGYFVERALRLASGLPFELRSQDFTGDLRGKCFEVHRIYNGEHVDAKSALEPHTKPEGFVGCVAPFLVWIVKMNPLGRSSTVLQDGTMLTFVNNLPENGDGYKAFEFRKLSYPTEKSSCYAFKEI